MNQTITNSLITPAKRLETVSEYYFSKKLKEIAMRNAKGENIISLAIGSPDMPPSAQTIETLCQQAKRDDVHGYQPTVGIPELRKAMADWYKRWYHVDLDPDSEIQPLIGSKEGILHVTLAFANPGDKVLVPNPGYPTYTSLTKLLGCDIVYYDLKEDNDWQPDFEALEHMDLSPQHADRSQCANGNVQKACRLCPSPPHSGCQRQSLQLYFEREPHQLITSA